MGEYYVDGQLFHHGVKGMKWGRRRYQNPDGSLTPAGKKRYYDGDVKSARAAVKSASKAYDKSFRDASRKNLQSYSLSKKRRKASEERWEKAYDDAQALNEAKANLKSAKAQAKIERKLKGAATAEGRAEYQRKKGDEAARKYDDTAKAYEKQAKKLEKDGDYVGADSARKTAEAFRKKSANAREEYDFVADAYLKRSEVLTKRAGAIATKKNVDLGKMRVESILKKAKKDGYQDEKEWDDIMEVYDEL